MINSMLRRFRWQGVVVLLLSSTMGIGGSSADVVVAYPDLSGPYQAVFEQIIKGVEETYSGGVTRMPMSADDPASLDNAKQALARHPDAAIVLGRTAFELIEPIHGSVPLVTGAVLAPPSVAGGMATGISLVPDPELLFQHLGRMVPAVTRVHVVVDRVRLAWLINHAETVAEQYQITLEVHDVSDLSDAALTYRGLLDSIDSHGGAIWLLAGSGVLDNQTVLPLVLRKAWARNLVVFSSSLAHVNRGALFALYPDHHALGVSLVELMQTRLDNPGQASTGLLPLRDLRLAVNSRTANHLRLSIDFESVSRQGLVFPRQ